MAQMQSEKGDPAKGLLPIDAAFAPGQIHRVPDTRHRDPLAVYDQLPGTGFHPAAEVAMGGVHSGQMRHHVEIGEIVDGAVGAVGAIGLAGVGAWGAFKMASWAAKETGHSMQRKE